MCVRNAEEDLTRELWDRESFIYIAKQLETTSIQVRKHHDTNILDCLQVPFNVWPSGPVDVVFTEVRTADRALTPLSNEILENQNVHILQSRKDLDFDDK